MQRAVTQITNQCVLDTLNYERKFSTLFIGVFCVYFRFNIMKNLGQCHMSPKIID